MTPDDLEGYFAGAMSAYAESIGRPLTVAERAVARQAFGCALLLTVDPRTMLAFTDPTGRLLEAIDQLREKRMAAEEQRCPTPQTPR